jgi:hypothetical protein
MTRCLALLKTGGELVIEVSYGSGAWGWRLPDARRAVTMHLGRGPLRVSEGKPVDIWTTPGGWKIDAVADSDRVLGTFEPTPAAGGKTAVRVRLQTKALGQTVDQWLLAGDRDHARLDLGLITVDLVAAGANAPLAGAPNRAIIRAQEDGSLPPVDLAIPAFGYKNHIAVDRAYGLIRKWTATHAAAHDGARLEDVLDRSNTASDVWADTAYRSAKNEAMLSRRGFVSRIHRKKPKGRPMPERTRISNARKSRVRSAVEHVFAHQKGLMGLVVRTVGIERAKVKIGMANLAYNMRRFVWLQGKYAPA